MEHLRPRVALSVATLVLLLLAGVPAHGWSQERPTTVIVVRHAEKASVEGRDPPLSEAGEQRARALIEAVGAAGVKAIYATQFQRTQQTARPLAEHLGVPLTVFAATADARQHAATLAGEILSKHAGEVVVVVGHSNTVPEIVQALGGTAVPEIPESEYHNLFVVVIPSSGPPSTIRARYGTQS
jgi:broad specificity phosphatase PhoE